jgi:hypothetical protein
MLAEFEKKERARLLTRARNLTVISTFVRFFSEISGKQQRRNSVHWKTYAYQNHGGERRQGQ